MLRKPQVVLVATFNLSLIFLLKLHKVSTGFRSDQFDGEDNIRVKRLRSVTMSKLPLDSLIF